VDKWDKTESVVAPFSVGDDVTALVIVRPFSSKNGNVGYTLVMQDPEPLDQIGESEPLDKVA